MFAADELDVCYYDGLHTAEAEVVPMPDAPAAAAGAAAQARAAGAEPVNDKVQRLMALGFSQQQAQVCHGGVCAECSDTEVTGSTGYVQWQRRDGSERAIRRIIIAICCAKHCSSFASTRQIAHRHYHGSNGQQRGYCQGHAGTCGLYPPSGCRQPGAEMPLDRLLHASTICTVGHADLLTGKPIGVL